MKQHGRKLRVVMAALCVLLLFILNLPFCRFSQIGTFNTDSTWHDRVLQFEERVLLYGNTLFLTKGKTYQRLLLSDNKRYKISFGWDNHITISSDRDKYILNVDSICINEGTFAASEEEFLTTDKYMTVIEFYDGKKRLSVFYQDRSMEFGGKRAAFEFTINGKEYYYTGKKSCPFNY